MAKSKVGTMDGANIEIREECGLGGPVVTSGFFVAT